jgi:hypothetical protein
MKGIETCLVVGLVGLSRLFFEELFQNSELATRKCFPGRSNFLVLAALCKEYSLLQKDVVFSEYVENHISLYNSAISAVDFFESGSIAAS